MKGSGLPGAVHRFAHRLAGALATGAVCGLLGVAAMVTIDVTLRYAFASPIRGFFDVQPLAFAVLLAACMPLAAARRTHIAVTLLGDCVERRFGGRLGRWLDRLGRTATLLFFGLMGWQYLRFAIDMQAAGETMAVLRWPVWPWWTAVAVLIVTAAAVAAGTLSGPDDAGQQGGRNGSPEAGGGAAP